MGPQGPSFLAFSHEEQASLVAQWERICLPMQEMWVPSLVREDPLEKEIATHSSILAWGIPWTEEPGITVRHDLVTKQCHLKNAHGALEMLLGSSSHAAANRARQAGTPASPGGELAGGPCEWGWALPSVVSRAPPPSSQNRALPPPRPSGSQRATLP